MAKKKGQTKKLTSSDVISTAGKTAIVRAMTLRSGTSDSVLRINDGGSGGSIKWSIEIDGTTNAGDNTESISFDEGILCVTDAYGTIGGTGAIGYVLYDEIED